MHCFWHASWKGNLLYKFSARAHLRYTFCSAIFSSMSPSPSRLSPRCQDVVCLHAFLNLFKARPFQVFPINPFYNLRLSKEMVMVDLHKPKGLAFLLRQRCHNNQLYFPLESIVLIFSFSKSTGIFLPFNWRMYFRQSSVFLAKRLMDLVMTLLIFPPCIL